MPNPFYYGGPVPHDKFLGRQRELHRIVSRLTNRGQSTAIVGEPRSGKTSLLLYLSAPETRAAIYGTEGERRLIFSYLDAQTLGEQFTPAQFWEHVLQPLYEQEIAPAPESPLAKRYAVCHEEGFSTFALERLLNQLEPQGKRVVLLLDEFDLILHHPRLNCAEFFGSLRSLASRSRGALALVIAGRFPLSRLNTSTQELSRTGSPYFNFLSEVPLGPLAQKDVTLLLSQGADRFTSDDIRFITALAGGHPYLIQVAACELWDAYDEGPTSPQACRQHVAEHLYSEVALTLADTWRLWPPEMRCAFTAAALQHLNTLLPAGAPAAEATVGTATQGDMYGAYETGLKQLLAAVGRNHQEALIYEQRLTENIAQCRRYGDNETRKSERAEIIARLNTLAVALTGTSFNALCEQESSLSLPIAVNQLREVLRDFRQELQLLERQGFACEDAGTPGGWAVRPLAFLWWLVDEILREVRDKPSLDAWWQTQGWEGLLTHAERNALGQALRAVDTALANGSETLLAAIVES